MLKYCQQVSILPIQEQRPAGGLRMEIRETTAAPHQKIVLQPGEKIIGWDSQIEGMKVPLVPIVLDPLQQINGGISIIK